MGAACEDRGGTVMKYKLKPEHEARFAEWRDKWIANAMSTEPMTENDREICRAAVIGMYSAAKLPAPKHIVFVPSPFVLAFAGGFSAAIWHGSAASAICWAEIDSIQARVPVWQREGVANTKAQG
jgi:hypothetical protein